MHAQDSCTTIHVSAEEGFTLLAALAHRLLDTTAPAPFTHDTDRVWLPNTSPHDADVGNGTQSLHGDTTQL